MKLIDSLIKQFGYNTPFMLSEIEKEDYSKQQQRVACDSA